MCQNLNLSNKELGRFFVLRTGSGHASRLVLRTGLLFRIR
jgi:hypothetical protein